MMFLLEEPPIKGIKNEISFWNDPDPIRYGFFLASRDSWSGPDPNADNDARSRSTVC